jgi:glycosyltransferase involved in cell wall biosynthesis
MAGGGAQRQLAYLSGELVRSGWDVHVALIQEGTNFGRLDATGATVHRVHAFGNHDPLILGRLIRTVRAVRPDVVQGWLLQMDVLCGLAAILTRTPLVFTERSATQAYPPSLKTWLRIQVGRRAAAIVSNSSTGDRYWQARAGNRVKRFVIPNGLPLDEIRATPPTSEPDMGLPADDPVVLYAGRLSAEKNVETIVRALRLVADVRPVLGIVCGDGPFAERLSGLISELDLGDQVRAVGYVSNLWSLMKRANVLVSVSFFEGNPNVVLEAMACGLPLIVSDIPAHRELLDERMTIFVDPGRPRQVADAIQSVLNDPAGAATRAQAALASAQSYALPLVAHRYAEVYRSVSPSAQ